MRGVISEDFYCIHSEPHSYVIGKLENIISNAVKYNKEGTTLYCYVRINDGIIIEMGDDGKGTFFNIEFSRLD